MSSSCPNLLRGAPAGAAGSPDRINVRFGRDRGWETSPKGRLQVSRSRPALMGVGRLLAVPVCGADPPAMSKLAPGPKAGGGATLAARKHAGRPLEASFPRLQAGPPGLWDASSSRLAVRELYENYAADPLSATATAASAVAAAAAAASPLRSGLVGAASGATAEGFEETAESEDFLAGYVERQREIEALLGRHRHAAASSSASFASGAFAAGAAA
eukprot:TRINITY_DN3405_c0_g2_i1.p2 TRINITY_DN3405_c0_g2~~TRINITY_DN3405_c0_g2_i1.p2  ORF type:complete len:216 (-),score=47.81 TRINITY_DN3405_c0_g2_i1:190-837(-)